MNTRTKETMIDVIIFAVAITLLGCCCGCQTVIYAKKNAEQAVELSDGKVVVISGGWEASARSPLWATESLRGLDIGVNTNSSVHLRIDTYNRDLSTNAVVLTEKTLDGAVNLAAKIGTAIASAGGSTSAEVVSSAAKTLYDKYIAAGGSVENAVVTCKDGVCTVSDGSASACTDCTP